MRIPLLIPALLLGGCIDTGFTSRSDGDAPFDTAPPDPGEAADTDLEEEEEEEEEEEPDPQRCEDLVLEPVEAVLSEECDVEPELGTFTPVVDMEVAGHMGFGPAVVGQLDDDNGDGVIDASDMPEICWVQNDDNGVVCVDGSTGEVELETTFGARTFDNLSGMAIADLDMDGFPELIVANGPTEVVVSDNLGNVVWRRSGLDNPQRYFTYPTIADLDADGFPEVIVGRNILSSTGDLLGTGEHGAGAVPNAAVSISEGSSPVAVDLDGDGLLEVVVGNAAYNIDGSARYTNGLADGSPAVADLDLDGEPEIVVVSGNTVSILETDLTPTGWSASFDSYYVGPPAIDDLDGDGVPEFVVQGNNEMRAYHGDGTLMWSRVVRDRSGAAGAILYDFEGDGYPEIVYADEVSVWVFNGLDGSAKLETRDHGSRTGFETPIVADVDNDGEVEIVALHSFYRKGMTVFGDADHSWGPGRQVWNQHAYSLTNIEDDLTIPRHLEANWLTYNNFRSGDAGTPPSHWNDVVAEIVQVCLEECPDTVALTVRVHNQGTEELPAGLPVSVRAGAEGPIVQTWLTDAAVPAGWTSHGVTLRIDAEDLLGEAPWVEADLDSRGDSTLTECLEDNNAVESANRCE